MARLHGGGFINADNYFNIGTEAARGRDGDSARVAAKKYNDHRHSAFLATSVDGLTSWVREQTDVSVDNVTQLPGGLVESPTADLIRKSGDVADYRGVLYATTTTGLHALSSGFGPSLDVSGDVPRVRSDFLVEQRSLLTTPPPVSGVAMGAAQSNGNTVPIYTRIGRGMAYESFSAHRADIQTRVVLTAGVRVQSVFDLEGFLAPNIGILITAKLYPADVSTGNMTLVNATPLGEGVLVTSLSSNANEPSALQNMSSGYTIATVGDLPGSVQGLMDVEAALSPSSCYTAVEFLAIEEQLGITRAEVESRLTSWMRDHVTLDLLDVTLQSVCTFTGE
jgi:hypothetical protein